MPEDAVADVAAARVADAAAHLDRQYPGWAFLIQVEILNLGSCSECVIGQLCGSTTYRDWAAAIETWFGRLPLEAGRRDATCPIGFSYDVFILNWPYLHAWRSLIQARQQAALRDDDARVPDSSKETPCLTM